jgi:tryptophan synthase alpha chain
MSIDKTFSDLKKRGEGALVAFITGGDPTPKYTLRLIDALHKGGADIIEVGIPFSDPIADGPIIQAADYRALSSCTTPHAIFDAVEEAKRKIDTPIALMTYYNILYKMGVKAFIKEASRHGVDGLIIPDLPIEEAGDYRGAARKEGLSTIFLATPLTSNDRLKDILGFSSGFLYLVSILGTTGTRDHVAKLTTQTITRFHGYTVNAIPLAVGFGISEPEHVKTVISCSAEAAIVGSAFVKKVQDNLDDPGKMVEDVSMLAKKLKMATLPPRKVRMDGFSGNAGEINRA